MKTSKKTMHHAERKPMQKDSKAGRNVPITSRDQKLEICHSQTQARSTQARYHDDLDGSSLARAIYACTSPLLKGQEVPFQKHTCAQTTSEQTNVTNMKEGHEAGTQRERKKERKKDRQTGRQKEIKKKNLRKQTE